MNPSKFYALSRAPVEKIAEGLKDELVRDGTIDQPRLLLFLARMLKMMMESGQMKVQVDLEKDAD